MFCEKCKQAQKETGDQTAMLACCGIPYYKGIKAAYDDLWAILTNPTLNREAVIKICREEVDRCELVIKNYGMKGK